MAMRMNARTGAPGPTHVVIVYHKGSGMVLETHAFSDFAAPDLGRPAAAATARARFEQGSSQE